VRHDNGRKGAVCVDQGPRYDSTAGVCQPDDGDDDDHGGGPGDDDDDGDCDDDLLLPALGSPLADAGDPALLDAVDAAMRAGHNQYAPMTGLPALREALSAPVKGLGLAFGTSVAGVAASAALGLVAALARRHRLQVAQALEAAVASQLWRLSAAHQREQAQQQAEQAQQQAQQHAQEAREAREAQQAQQREQRWQLQQDQARLLPQMVAQMATQWEATMARMAQHHDTMHTQWVVGQERFHEQAQAVHAELAAQVQRSLQEGLHTHLAESARQAGTVWQPALEATLAGLAQQAALQQERVEAAVLQQLEGMGSRLGTTAAALETGWTQLLDSHARHGEKQAQGLQEALQAFMARRRAEGGAPMN
jgi:hypothetical protein